MHELGEVLRERSRLDEAETLHRGALAMREQLLGTDNESVPTSLDLLAKTLWERGQFQEAEALLRRALAIEKRLHGERHFDVASCLRVLGSTLQQAGKLPEAERTYDEALVLAKGLPGADSLIPILLQDLSTVRAAQQRPNEGLEYFRQALPLFEKLLQSNNADPEISARFDRVIKALAEPNAKIQAEDLMTNLLAVQRKLMGDQNSSIAVSLHVLGSTIQNQGRPAEAEKLYREALAIRRRVWGDQHRLVAASLGSVASALTEQGRLGEAETFLTQRLDICRRLYGKDSAKLDAPLLELADVFYRQAKHGQAEPFYRELIMTRMENPAPGTGTKEDAMASLGRSLADWAWAERGAPAAWEHARQAEALLREVLASRVSATNVSQTKLGDTKSRLGGAVLSVAVCDPESSSAVFAARCTEAESFLLAGYELMQADTSVSSRSVRDSLQRLVRLYEAWKSVAPNAGHEAKLATWKERLAAFEGARQGPPDMVSPKK
jgi:tetratricopeptide (TPR) repeat protein